MTALRPVEHATLKPSPGTDPMPPVSWRLWGDGLFLAVTCDRGHSASVDLDTVDAAGFRHPSIGCPEPGCGWHVWATLEGWEQR